MHAVRLIGLSHQCIQGVAHGQLAKGMTMDLLDQAILIQAGRAGQAVHCTTGGQQCAVELIAVASFASAALCSSPSSPSGQHGLAGRPASCGPGPSRPCCSCARCFSTPCAHKALQLAGTCSCTLQALTVLHSVQRHSALP